MSAERSRYVIKSESLPFRTGDVTIEEPLFVDKVEAFRKAAGAGGIYSTEQLMLAKSVIAVGGRTSDPFMLRDPIATIKEFPPGDLQYILNFYVGLFLVYSDKELVESAKSLGDELRRQNSAAVVIPADATPSGMHSYTLAPLTSGEQLELARLIPNTDDAGYDLSELCLARSIVAIDGQPVQKEKNPIGVLYNLRYVDVQFISMVFTNLFFIDEGKREEARLLGKSLYKRGNSSVDSSTRSTKKTQQTSNDKPQPE